MRSKDYKQNMLVNLITVIIIFPSLNMLKEAYVFAVIAFFVQICVVYLTKIFTWQRMNIRWYSYYLYGIQILFCAVSLAIHREWLGYFSGWAPIVLLVYFTELHLAKLRQAAEVSKMGSSGVEPS